MAKRDPAMLDLVGNAGAAWDRERISRELGPAIHRAREPGLQLSCGELGCLPTVPPARTGWPTTAI
jgi:endoglucanase